MNKEVERIKKEYDEKIMKINNLKEKSRKNNINFIKEYEKAVNSRTLSTKEAYEKYKENNKALQDEYDALKEELRID